MLLTITVAVVNPPLRMRRAGYSSRCVCVCLCVCHGAALAGETFSTIETGHQYKVGDDQKDLNEVDF